MNLKTLMIIIYITIIASITGNGMFHYYQDFDAPLSIAYFASLATSGLMAILLMTLYNGVRDNDEK